MSYFNLDECRDPETLIRAISGEFDECKVVVRYGVLRQLIEQANAQPIKTVFLEPTPKQVPEPAAPVVTSGKAGKGRKPMSEEARAKARANIVKAREARQAKRAKPVVINHPPEALHSDGRVSPTDASLNLVGTMGWARAQIIQHAADGLMAQAIFVHLSEWVESPMAIEKVMVKDAERIALAKTFDTKEARGVYINGLAVAFNKEYTERSLKKAGLK